MAIDERSMEDADFPVSRIPARLSGASAFSHYSRKPQLESGIQSPTDDNDPVTETARYSWRIYCLDRQTGRIHWERVAHEGVPRVKRHLKASQANSTPVTDGQYVVTAFASEGLFCYDFEGRKIWQQDLGVLDPGLHDDPAVQWGYASSPVIWKNLVIIQCDAHAQSFIAAFDLKSGKRLWSTPRGELPSWSTPVIYNGKTRDELITNAPRFIRAYDPASGKELWRFANNDLIVQVPTPFVANDLIYLTGGWPGGRPVKVLKPGANGEISIKDQERSHIAWLSERGGPYVPTPIVYRDHSTFAEIRCDHLSQPKDGRAVLSTTHQRSKHRVQRFASCRRRQNLFGE
jgi:outer membrane protein assembly factor BamB